MGYNFTENQKELIEAMVGLLIIFPNPQLKDRKGEIMKIAYDILSKQMEEDELKPEKEISDEELEEIEFYDYLLEEEDEED